MDLERKFIAGRMEKDADERFINGGLYRDAKNVRVVTSESSDAGSVENIQGNKVLTTLGLSNAECLYALADEQNQRVYWWIKSDEYHGIIEYDKLTENAVWVLQSTAP